MANLKKELKTHKAIVWSPSLLFYVRFGRNSLLFKWFLVQWQEVPITKTFNFTQFEFKNYKSNMIIPVFRAPAFVIFVVLFSEWYEGLMIFSNSFLSVYVINDCAKLHVST